MSDPGRRFFFVHLQKTAGTALFRRLRHHFGTDAVYPLPEEQGTPETVLDVDRLRRRLGESGEQFRVITGHFPLATVDLLPGEFSTFTVLRDPVERVLSFLRHQREVDPRFVGSTLDEIYDDPISQGPLVRNHMVRMLSLTTDEMTAGALTPIGIDEDRLRRAREALTDRIDVVGLQDHFEDFCSDLAATFDWDLGPPVFMNRTRPADASASLLERIAADNGPDLSLYRTACTLWERKHAGS